ncbi:MarR family winged helix-turn-helix transcriptional regulator [Skermania piniformis]|uniref:MarR family winged helix-turn-helix transcriptional regulator n=1 Tax=Skermania pinensis TaxID=39122 RepID=UPI00082AAF39|nr:MarR family transcriptional regulator [Skermania piniformis]
MQTPDTSPGFLLWRVTLRWQREITAALKPLGLTHVQFVLLATCWWLNRSGQHPTQVALADFAGVDVKMASQVIRALETAGLLGREVDPDDSRARRLHTTPRGDDLAPRAIALVEAVDQDFFGALPATTGAALTRALRGLS